VNTVFQWCLEEREVTKSSKKSNKPDKMTREIVQIPYILPPGFNLRVRANSLHKIATGKKLVELSFGVFHFYVAIRTDATLENLNASAAAVLEAKGQANQR
jgi:hypothetical protein